MMIILITPAMIVTVTALTIALMCLSIVFLTHKAKLSGIALSSAELPSNSAANAPLMMHNEARGAAGTTLFSSPTFVSGESDNSPTLEWNPTLSKTLNQSPHPGTISNAVEKAALLADRGLRPIGKIVDTLQKQE
jgi:hypothetical protein